MFWCICVREVELGVCHPSARRISNEGMKNGLSDLTDLHVLVVSPVQMSHTMNMDKNLVISSSVLDG